MRETVKAATRAGRRWAATSVYLILCAIGLTIYILIERVVA